MEPEEIAGGRYRVEAVLGRGGTATVYRVQDTILDVPRAVKILSGSSQVRRALRRRLYAEAKAMARLDHPNILRLYDIGLDGDRDYVVMELAEGGTLGQQLSRQGPLPPYEALQFILQILSALASAHDQGIVHRDVKPENVLLNQSGTALLADFGIALLAKDASRATQMGVTMGSLAYMPPEQRLDARSVTATADVYAVGATLYNLLTDENPIDLFTAAESSPRWSSIPHPLLNLLRKATQIEPEQRYSDAREMARDVLILLDQIEVDMPPLRAKSRPHQPATQSHETFLMGQGSATRPGKDATDAAVQFLTSMPITGETNPTLAPDGFSASLADPSPPKHAPRTASAPHASAERSGQPRGLLKHKAALLSLIAGMVLAAGGFAAVSTVFNAPTDPSSTAATPATPASHAVATAIEDSSVVVEEPPTPAIVEEPPVVEESPTPPVVEEPPTPAVVEEPPVPAVEDPPAPVVEEPIGDPVASAGPPESAPSAQGIAGSWSGSSNGRPATIRLSGSNTQLVGTITVTIGSNEQPTPVQGRLDEDTQMLYLTASEDGQVIAKYALKLTPDGTRLQGDGTRLDNGSKAIVSLRKN